MPRARPLKPFRETLRRNPSAHGVGELGAILNLGPKSREWLADAGIATRAELEKLGPIAACRRMRRAGHPVSVAMAYAIEAGLAGCHWQALPGETKNFLRTEFAKLRREEAARPG